MKKAIFIAYNQAYYSEVVEILDANGVRGYTMWQEISGRGSYDGEPHEGSHAWPTMNNALITVVEADRVAPILAELRSRDAQAPELGIRAFVWNVENEM